MVSSYALYNIHIVLWYIYIWYSRTFFCSSYYNLRTQFYVSGDRRDEMERERERGIVEARDMLYVVAVVELLNTIYTHTQRERECVCGCVFLLLWQAAFCVFLLVLDHLLSLTYTGIGEKKVSLRELYACVVYCPPLPLPFLFFNIFFMGMR
ncbi:hypothetical protein F4809DRAFT_407019 [Biscogniauxia mediterranea]|nr:hypothetical protein F4809DRAFT_407019 [Biscogniauxia mediterranea]